MPLFLFWMVPFFHDSRETDRTLGEQPRGSLSLRLLWCATNAVLAAESAPNLLPLPWKSTAKQTLGEEKVTVRRWRKRPLGCTLAERLPALGSSSVSDYAQIGRVPSSLGLLGRDRGAAIPRERIGIRSRRVQGVRVACRLRVPTAQGWW